MYIDDRSEFTDGTIINEPMREPKIHIDPLFVHLPSKTTLLALCKDVDELMRKYRLQRLTACWTIPFNNA